MAVSFLLRGRGDFEYVARHPSFWASNYTKFPIYDRQRKVQQLPVHDGFLFRRRQEDLDVRLRPSISRRCFMEPHAETTPEIALSCLFCFNNVYAKGLSVLQDP